MLVIAGYVNVNFIGAQEKFMPGNGEMCTIFSALAIIRCTVVAMATYKVFNFKSPIFL
jgi:hypothetical protein